MGRGQRARRPRRLSDESAFHKMCHPRNGCTNIRCRPIDPQPTEDLSALVKSLSLEGLIDMMSNERDASRLKRIYGKAALIYHPDRNPGQETKATGDFKRMLAAYHERCDVLQHIIDDGSLHRSQTREPDPHRSQTREPDDIPSYEELVREYGTAHEFGKYRYVAHTKIKPHDSKFLALLQSIHDNKHQQNPFQSRRLWRYE
jgi:hypothetical protein